MKPFAIAAILATTLTLTACGDAPDKPAETPAATTQTAPAADPAPSEAPAVSIEVPANTMVPGTNMTAQHAQQQVQAQVEELKLTDDEKRQAVADARKAAEDAARTAGLTNEQITQAGDAAEQAAKTMFGIQ